MKFDAKWLRGGTPAPNSDIRAEERLADGPDAAFMRPAEPLQCQSLISVSCHAGGCIDHRLLADFNEASARPVEVLDQEYHG
jgi:hypothetical protein